MKVTVNGEERKVSNSYGDLNTLTSPDTSDYYESENMSGIDAIKKTVTSHYSKRKIHSGPYKGIVLKVMEVSQKRGWWDILAGDPLVSYKIRVPELDAHLPEPAQLEPEENSTDYKIIDSHSTFVSRSKSVSEMESATPGDLVWVDYENGEAVYLGLIDNKSGEGSGNGGSGGSSGEGGGEAVNLPPSSYSSKGAFNQGGGSSRVLNEQLKIVKYDKKDPPKVNNWTSRNYKTPRLLKVREDMAAKMTHIYNICHKLGGHAVFYSSYRWPNAARKSGPAASFHFTSTANDLHTATVTMRQPHKEDFILEADNRYKYKRFVLWLKVPTPMSIQYEGKTWTAERRTLNALVTKHRTPVKTKKMTAVVVNFTELFEYYGAQGVPPQERKIFWATSKCYEDGVYSEAWHYDLRHSLGLVAGQTTWEDHLATVDWKGSMGHRGDIRKTKIWKARKRVWRGGYFGNP